MGTQADVDALDGLLPEEEAAAPEVIVLEE